ncbi:hypothetical protein ABE494_08090 [Stenotrophomonas lactitubi]|uniref:hypothetical protein n=1 Tax=Stenotrophomonas lactitubi TaxID=2045214 RepID=UPI003209E245
MAQIDLAGYSRKDVRSTFNHLRRYRWLEATVSFDVEGLRYSGLVVSLTPMGHAAARALSAEATLAPATPTDQPLGGGFS